MTNLLLHLAAAWQVGGDARPPDKDWAQAIGLSVPELVAMAGMAEGKVRSAVRRMVYGDYVWSYDGYAYHGRAAIYRLTVRGAAFVEFAARVGLVDSSWASAGLVKSVSRGVKDEQKMWEAPVRLRPEQLAQPWPV
jgi:DNA-binding transcriptional regulator PaaX